MNSESLKSGHSKYEDTSLGFLFTQSTFFMLIETFTITEMKEFNFYVKVPFCMMHKREVTFKKSKHSVLIKRPLLKCL